MPDEVNRERAAILRVSYSALAELLQLPAGSVIDAIESNIQEEQMVTVRVRGAGWLVAPGYRIPIASATITDYRDDDGRCFKRVIEWNFPGSSA